MWLAILILAIVQGIAEFLPVSSSGHIAVGTAILEDLKQIARQGEHEKLSINIVLHVGTLAAILVFYRQRIARLLGRDRRIIGLLIVGSVPAAIAGLILKKYLLTVLTSPLTAGLMFPITGLMLIWSKNHSGGETTSVELSYPRAILIGLFQSFAILPGISRSGSTIVAGLSVGLRRDEAAAFSFLLAIPAIGGAALLDFKDLLHQPPESVSLAALALGAVVSFAVGLAALAWLIRWLERGRLHWFAWYVIPLGIAVIVWQLLG